MKCLPLFISAMLITSLNDTKHSWPEVGDEGMNGGMEGKEVMASN